MTKDYTPLYILTWNPHKFDWKNYRHSVEICKRQGLLVTDWSCRSNRPNSNDRFIFLMQGMGNKNGVIGAGRFLRKPEDVGYDTEFGARFAPIKFDMFLDYDIDDYIRTSFLKENFPNQCWTPQISGTRIRASYVPDVWNMVHK